MPKMFMNNDGRYVGDIGLISPLIFLNLSIVSSFRLNVFRLFFLFIFDCINWNHFSSRISCADCISVHLESRVRNVCYATVNDGKVWQFFRTEQRNKIA